MEDDRFRHSFDEIEKLLGDVLGRYSPIPVLLLNTTSPDELDYDAVPDLNAIIVGGNKLSRGLTLEGLLVSYFIRSTRNPNADTLLQMGRFFGYTLDRVAITRIFTTAQLREDFREISAMEVLLRSEIARYERSNLTPADFAPRVLHTRIRPTARNKMTDAILTGEVYSGNLIQTTSFIVEKEGVQQDKFENAKNLALTRELLQELSKSDEIEKNTNDSGTRNLYRNVQSSRIAKFLHDFKAGAGNTRFIPAAIQSYIEDMNSIGLLEKWSVALISRTPDSSLGVQVFDGIGEVGRIERALESDSDRSIGQLINPIGTSGAGNIYGDEVADFSPEEKDQLLALKFEIPSISLAQAARQIRPENRGLLLVYPISPQSVGQTDSPGKDSKTTLGESIFGNRHADITLIGLAMVFPHADRPEIREYWQGTAGRSTL
jgi:hypothetical protein